LQRLVLPLVGIIFFISGALALVYEVTWARMLAREFGSDAVAIAIIVAVFMLGLGLGARLAGRMGDSVRNPLRIYGFLEIGLSLYVLASPWLIGMFLPVLGLLGHGAIENIWLLNGARVLLGLLVLLPPTLLMGAGLPLVVRFAIDVARNGPSAAVALYAINIVGAVAGVLAAGFWLLPVMGMTSLLQLAALANLGLGLCVLAVSRLYDPTSRPRLRDSEPADRTTGQSGLNLVAAVFLVGLASMACQLAWTRVIVLIVGGSAYAFATVLAIFLVGLGLGAWLAAGIARMSDDQVIRWFLGAGLAAVAAMFVSTMVLPLMPGLFLDYFDPDLADSRWALLQIQVLVSAALFLAPVTFMGMLFPLILRVGLADHDRSADVTGRLYLANTAGCVVGALAAGLAMIPAIGILPTLLIAIGAICYAVLLIHSGAGSLRTQIAVAVVLIAGYGVGWFLVPPWNAQVMAGGISEYARAYQQIPSGNLAADLAQRSELLFYRDGRTATVTVSRNTSSRAKFIATNGKIDGSTSFDMPTQKLSAHLPLLLHPSPRDVAVVGLGTGITAGTVTLYPEVEQVNVIEIEPAMVEGSRWFARYNHRVHDHRKVNIRVADGRLHLMLSSGKYDVITSEPSNLWIAGIANLFTREFFELGARALRPDGIFAQWIHVYDTSPDNLQSVVRTFQEVFPHTWLSVTIPGSDLLLIGSRQSIDLDPERMARRMTHDPIRQDLASDNVEIHDVWDLLSRIWLSPEEVVRFAGEARIHRDDWPFLMYEAPLTRYEDTRATNMRMIAEPASGLIVPLIEEGLPAEDAERLLSAYLHFVPPALMWSAPMPDTD
jgi:spermidine synthase